MPMQANYAQNAAATDLGLGNMAATQRQDETEEQKRRRLLLEQMKEAVNPFGASATLGLVARQGMSRPGGYL